MASEIRVDKINSLSGVGTVTLSPTGVDIAGITTAATLRATTGIVTSLTAGSLTSLGAVSGTTGTFSGAVSGTTGTFSGALSGTTATFSSTTTVEGALTLVDTIVHSGDDNTKIRFPAADTVSIETAGSERVRVDSSGNLQVVRNVSIDNNGELAVFEDDTSLGYTNSAKLSLDYASNVARIRSSGNGSFSQRPLAFFMTNTEVFRIDTDGDFGLGTSSPTYTNALFGGSQRTLHVSGTAAPMVRIQSGTSGQADLLLQAGNSGADAYIANAASNGDLVFSTNNGGSQGTRVRIRHDGGINFGTDNATANALDDYEEGTWTPSAVVTHNGSGSGSVSSSSAHGQYTKIGRTVTCHFTININASNISGCNVGIDGLPFTCQFTNNLDFNAGAARRGIIGGETYMLEGVLDNNTRVNVIRGYANGGLSDGNQSINGFFMYTTTA